MVDPQIPSQTAGATNRDKAATAQFVGFRIGDQPYAFCIEKIQEIVILDQITPTPQVADFVDGVSNLRGEIIPIISLRRLLGLTQKPADSETRTIVANVGERTMGCTVDMVSQIMRIPAADIHPPPETVTAEGADYIQGFAKLDDKLVIVLDLDRLLAPDKMGGKMPGTSASDSSPSSPLP